MNSDILAERRVYHKLLLFKPSFFFMEDLMKMEFFRCSEFFVHPHPYIPSYGVFNLFSVEMRRQR